MDKIEKKSIKKIKKKQSNLHLHCKIFVSRQSKQTTKSNHK